MKASSTCHRDLLDSGGSPCIIVVACCLVFRSRRIDPSGPRLLKSTRCKRTGHDSGVVAGTLAPSGFQETRPRRVNPPGPEDKATGNHNNAGAPPAIKKVSMTSGRGFHAPPSNASKLGFTVQLGAFLHADNAERLAGMLSSKGYDAQVSTKGDSQHREWHLVRVGSHSDRRSAQAAAREIEKSLKIKAIVRPAGSL